MLDADKDLVQTIVDNDDPDDPKERAKNRAKAKKEAKKSLRKKVVGVSSFLFAPCSLLIVAQMNKAAAKSKKGTVGSAFKASLAELMSEMSVAAPHFIRCIKPNEQKVQQLYSSFLVSHIQPGARQVR